MNTDSKIRQIVWIGAGVLVAIIIGITVAEWPSSPSPVTTEAATACISAYQAATEYTSGQRSLDSTMTALRRAESDERQAADQDPKYQTVVDDIVGLEADLTGTGSGAHLQFLNEDCGLAHG